MQLGLIGYGKMGRAVERAAKGRGHQITAIVTRDAPLQPEAADLFIDFSHSSATPSYLRQLMAAKKPLVIGTTGWDDQMEEAKTFVEKMDGCALYAPNFSLGVAFFIQLLQRASSLLSDYERAGLEIHHSEKKDAPSGTAKQISHLLDLPFTSMRLGNFCGTHQVIFDSAADRITLTHEAKNREAFALGAIKVGEWLQDKTGWLTLNDYIHSNYHPL